MRHHLDLLKDARGTRRRYHGTRALHDLEILRRWDLGGRDPNARVVSLEGALDQLVDGDDSIFDTNDQDGSFDPDAR